ncbi:MAG: HAMP domain-containing protein [Myxococcaceae bacterium]|nr:HAMP domain-containing protein [Myxococcaceae bacterium]
MQRSIRYQIVGVVGAMLIGALATYLWLASDIFASDKLASLKDVTRVLASTAAEQVDASVEALAEKLRFYGRSRPAPDELFPAGSGVHAVRVFSREGSQWQEVSSFVRPGAPGAVAQVAPLTAVQLDTARVAGLVVDNTSVAGTALSRIAVAAGETMVVTASVEPGRVFRSIAAGGIVRLYLLDAGGRVLLHPEPDKVLQQVDLSAVPVVRDALKAELPSGEREYESATGGWVSSFTRTRAGQLVVVAEAPREEAFRAARALTTRALVVGALMIGIAVALAVYFSRRVSAPLAALQGTIERIARGELGAEVEMQSANEIGSLAESFNQMSRELMRRSEELDRKNQQLVQSEKMSAIGELSAGLAHEVKNPMVGIVGFAQLGQESTSLDEAREYFKLIDNDAQRANGILQNLLEFARPPDVEQEVLEFNQVVAGAVRLTAHQLQLNGVRVHTDYADGLPKIRGNGNQLRQVLLNLLMNASQAMEGFKDKHLYVQTKGGDAGAQVSVRDVGPGIAPDAQARIFEPFFTTKPRGKGTGLGLSVSRSIIEAHRGEIRVESEMGKGATFFIRLPSADALLNASGPFPTIDDLKATRH